MKLDRIHAKILAALQSNARISNTQIAASVGISSPAVAERIKKMEGMEKSGFIFNKDKCVNITRFDIL